MELQTAEQMNQPLTGESRFTPSPATGLTTAKRPGPDTPVTINQRVNDYFPAPIKHPVRFSISGVMDKIPDLKKTIQDSDLDDGLKSFLCSELDKMKSNAAEIHLHDVERPDGGFDLHVSLKSITLGARPDQIFKKPAETDKAQTAPTS